MQIYHLKKEREKIESSNARLRAENQKLPAQIERMKHSKDEVEKVARGELGLVKGRAAQRQPGLLPAFLQKLLAHGRGDALCAVR